jgi:uncharacterized protein YbcC (UPF0753/DUF2309 family)
MEQNASVFDEAEVLHRLQHYLPAQAPLKDFIHHNTLHAFQHLPFHAAASKASHGFGFRTYLSLAEYRARYQEGTISPAVLDRTITSRKGPGAVRAWREKMLGAPLDETIVPRIGALRDQWKRSCRINLDAYVHPLLFRITCAYLDQGVAVWEMPVHEDGFLHTIQALERRSRASLFRTESARALLLSHEGGLTPLLDRLVGNPVYYEQYLFDQQFAHPGWAGMVATVEAQPQTLVASRPITLQDWITLELIWEIDTLDHQLGGRWRPLAEQPLDLPGPLFADAPPTELDEVYALWQEAFEWSYYDQVLAAFRLKPMLPEMASEKRMQAIFCIDDRECSMRRGLEGYDARIETFGTAGFFGVPCYYQPEFGKTMTKICPAPITPKHIVRELHSNRVLEKDAHFGKRSHTLFRGLVDNLMLGAWSGIKLATNVVFPSETTATASSFRHVSATSQLTIERDEHTPPRPDGLYEGFTVGEMATLMENLLRAIGLVEDFAPLVYFVGHGASSTNNTHYAGYDCGACSGRPGSVNARIAAFMLNHPKVRALLSYRGIRIPESTRFIGALHDTTRDEIAYYDLQVLDTALEEAHAANTRAFAHVLDLNAKERSRRFEHIDTRKSLHKVHQEIRLRSVSLFETRPELNHATNALCVVGRRELTRGIFLDRRAFLHSYDSRIDPDGESLTGILRAVAPVCGGINLEYYFSRVDNQRLGAGTKLPHNVMGLIGVANGIDGDLRPGLPFQMIDIHDPLRLLVVVEHHPEVVLRTIQREPATYEWFANEWVRLVAIDPASRQSYLFEEGYFCRYDPQQERLPVMDDMVHVWEAHEDNIPVHLIKTQGPS